AGRLYAAGAAGGVSASADGGRTWTELGGGISDNPPSQLISCRGSLWAATATGVFRYALAPVAAGSPRWWALVLGAAGAAGLVALVLAAIPRVRPPSAQRRPAPRPPRPFMGAEEYFANVASDQGGVVKR